MWVYYYGILLLNNFVLRLIMCLHWFQVTHILNVAYGVENVFPDLFIYKTLSILDLPDTDIISHIEECARFIDQAKAEVTFAFCFMVNSWLHLVNILWFQRMFLHKFCISAWRPGSIIRGIFHSLSVISWVLGFSAWYGTVIQWLTPGNRAACWIMDAEFSQCII